MYISCIDWENLVITDLSGQTLISNNGKKYVLSRLLANDINWVVYAEKTGKYIIKLAIKPTNSFRKKFISRISILKSLTDLQQLNLPVDLFSDPYVGYAIRKLKGYSSYSLLCPRQQSDPISWYNVNTGGLQRRLSLGYNLALLFAKMHKDNLIFENISEKNIFFSKKLTEFDVQIMGAENIYVPGFSVKNVDNTRYLAPEIVKEQLLPDTISDNYSLAVILFELLHIGHPYVGNTVIDQNEEVIRQAYLGLFPYVNEVQGINNSSYGISSDVVLTKELKDLFYRAFVSGKKDRTSRPTAIEFVVALQKAYDQTMQCDHCHAWFYVNSKNKKVFVPGVIMIILSR